MAREETRVDDGKVVRRDIDEDLDRDARPVPDAVDEEDLRERPPLVPAAPRRAMRPTAYPDGLAEARARFGGIDLPASLVGMLTALALVTLLAGLVGAAFGAIGYQTGLSRDVGQVDVTEITAAGFAGGIIVLFLSFLIGGWAAGRIARYDGARNGLMAAVCALVLAAIVAGLAAVAGDEYDILSRIDLPQFFDRNALTGAAIVSGAAAIIAMLAGGFIGGLWGARYHRRADETIVARPPVA